MKKALFLSVFVMFASICSFAQTAAEPEFVNQPYYVAKDGSLSKLEKQVSENKAKVKGGGWGGVATVYHLDGGDSPVRVKEAKPSFMVKLEKEGVDPETMWVLTKCDHGKKGRDIPVSQSAGGYGAAFGASGKSVKKNYVKLSFTKVSGSTYKVTVESPLESGAEYAFFAATDQGGQGGSRVPLFAFGKD